jgi:epoxyqueuosine reductase
MKAAAEGMVGLGLPPALSASAVAEALADRSADRPARPVKRMRLIRMNRQKEELRKLAKEGGAAVFGVADLGPLKEKYPDLLKHFPGSFSRAIVAGIRLQDAVVDGIENQPTVLYYHNYRQTNYELDRLGFCLAASLQESGFRAAAVPASQIIKTQPMQGHISHKLLAWAAGIGFSGRQTLLVHPQYGARMRYVSVLTDCPLDADQPWSGDGCGKCNACVSACPAGAIHNDRDDFDLEACCKKLTEFTKIPYVGQYICGVCVKACTAENRRKANESRE